MVTQALKLTSSVLTMSQDQLSTTVVTSVIAVVNAVCGTGSGTWKPPSSGSNTSTGASGSTTAVKSLASNVGVSQTILSIVSRMNVARAESSVVAAHGELPTPFCTATVYYAFA